MRKRDVVAVAEKLDCKVFETVKVNEKWSFSIESPKGKMFKLKDGKTFKKLLCQWDDSKVKDEAFKDIIETMNSSEIVDIPKPKPEDDTRKEVKPNSKVIELSQYLDALEIVRQYRLQLQKDEVTVSTSFFEWKSQNLLRAPKIELIQKMFNDGYFNVKSGLIRDLTIKHLSDLKESEYRAVEGVGNGFIRDIKELCKKAGLIIED